MKEGKLKSRKEKEYVWPKPGLGKAEHLFCLVPKSPFGQFVLSDNKLYIYNSPCEDP